MTAASHRARRTGYAIAPADGSPIFYEVQEPTSGRAACTIVLSDGIGCDGYVWKYLRTELAGQARLIHWHYRGHGRTPPPRAADRIGIPDLADDLAAVLEDAGVAQAILLGHSMGVQVSLETYRRHRSRVSGLVLVCGAPGTPLRTFRGSTALETVLPRVRRAVERAPGLFSGLSRTLIPTRLIYKLAAAVEINAELIEPRDFMPYLRGLSRIDPSFFLAMLSAAGQHSALDLLPDIDVPTLIVAGSRDGFTPAALSQRMAEAIRDAELLIVEDGSHTAPLERPDVVNRVVREFLVRRLALTALQPRRR